MRFGVAQKLPDITERFDRAFGFNSGTHFWDVEVGENAWALGVITESVQRIRSGL